MPEWERIDSEMADMRCAVYGLQTRSKFGAEHFDCQFFDECCKSLEKRVRREDVVPGDWTYVGYQYGSAMINGRCAKVLFVAMERPLEKPETFGCTQGAFRSSCFERSNAHMGGTDVVLKYLLDCPTTREDRCQQFTLTNSVRCRPRPKNARSGSTSTMAQRCQRHTESIVDELKPDIIVTQGSKFSYQQIVNLFNLKDLPRTGNGGQRQQKRWVEVGKRNGIIFLLTAHPANYPGFAWKSGRLPCHLRNAIQAVRDLWDRQGRLLDGTTVVSP